MTLLAMNGLLAIAWGALWGSLSPINLLAGFLLGYAGLWFARDLIGRGEQHYFRALPQSVILAVYFVKELVKSCVNVARDCISPKPRLHPAIVRMPLDVTSDIEIFLVANLISLTPGTLTLDVAEDRSFLVIHSIYAEDPDALVAELKSGMEHRVREVFRK
ncbi:Na+/H+ antiporter subunit E [Haematobacter genomosp. 1]|uniref:Sodium:proton antiporter n=1 Tax=Haematobacter genomosp. 1 TaxID=366618 RepID=A0A212A9C4_9RHOB|nr:Na+/H+ antiporter subunit E [Haematobacter genomosp. 1]OWJ76575.1 sodium:proton antiporter [Haematobacter genomosp. 1]